MLGEEPRNAACQAGPGEAYGNVSDTAQLFTTPRFTDEETKAWRGHCWHTSLVVGGIEL